MRVMVIVKATADSEAGALPSAELMADMGAFNQKLIEAGIMLDGAGVKPTSKGARRLFGQGPDRHQRPVPECQRTRLGLLDLEGQGPGRSDRLGQTLPQSDAGTVDDRNPRALRDGGLRVIAVGCHAVKLIALVIASEAKQSKGPWSSALRLWIASSLRYSQ
jgi:hypothetical protein